MRLIYKLSLNARNILTTLSLARAADPGTAATTSIPNQRRVFSALWNRVVQINICA